MLTYLKTTIIVIAVLLGSLATYIYFAFDKDYQIELALDEMLKEEYSSASKTLQDLNGEIPTAQIYLYQAYIDREQENLISSNKHLQLALEETVKTRTKPEVVLEIHLNRALNAYLLQDDAKLFDPLQSSRGLATSDAYMQQLLGLERSVTGHYEEALALWKDLPAKRPLSPWMTKAFDKRLTISWQTLATARCLIETGKYLQGRELVEKAKDTLPEESKSEAAFLLGLSYVNEASEKPETAALPYYRLAISYFQQVPASKESFSRERRRIIELMQQRASLLIQQRLFDDLSLFTDELEACNAHEALNTLSQQLVTVFNEELSKDRWELVQQLSAVLSTQLKPGYLLQDLSTRLESFVKVFLNKGDLARLSHYWEVICLFSKDQSAFTERFAVTTTKKALETIASDDDSLSQTARYISFWDKLEKNKERRNHFASQLISEAETLWEMPGKELQGLQLMKLAAPLPLLSDQDGLQEAISDTLNKVYTIAYRENAVDKLKAITEAVHYFHIVMPVVQEKSELANQLADAQYLLLLGRYVEAQKRAELALSLDATNQQAMKIAGLAYYQLGQNAKAIEVLSAITKPDASTQEAIGLSFLALGKTEQGEEILLKLANQEPVSDSAYEALGYLAEEEGNFSQGFNWFSQIRKPSAEVKANLCVTAYGLKEWSTTLEYFQQLPAPYKGLHELQAIAVHSWVEVGKTETAEALLRQALGDDPPSPQLFSSNFQEITLKALKDKDLHYTAALFYKHVQGDHPKAISAFNDIIQPWAEVYLSKGETYLTLGALQEAEKNLLLAVSRGEEPSLRLQAMPLLATTYTLMGRLEEAYLWYDRYFDANPTAANYRKEFALVLKQMMRWDLVRRQYQTLSNLRPLSTEESLESLTSLFHLGRFEQARQEGKTLTAKAITLTPTETIQLARVMAAAGGKEWGKRVAQSMTDPEKIGALPDAAKGSLLSLALDLGDTSLGNLLAEKMRDQIGETKEKEATLPPLPPAALFALAKWELKQTHEALAIELARRALTLAPFNGIIAGFISQYDTNPQRVLPFLHQTEAKLNSIIGTSPSTLPLLSVLSYARQSVHLATLLGSSISPLQQQSKHHLETTLQLLKTASGEHPEFPEIFLLLGKALSLIGESKQAQQALYKVIAFNPSCVDAYKALANLQEAEGSASKAVESLEIASKYDPNDGVIWTRLGELTLGQQDFVVSKKHLLKAIELYPGKSGAHTALGKVYLNEQQWALAQEQFQNAIDLTPNDIELLSSLFENLHTAPNSTSKEENPLQPLQQMIYQRLYELAPQQATDLLTHLKPKTSQQKME